MAVMIQVVDQSIVKCLFYRLIHIPDQEKAIDLVNLLRAKLKLDRILEHVKKNLGGHPKLLYRHSINLF